MPCLPTHPLTNVCTLPHDAPHNGGGHVHAHTSSGLAVTVSMEDFLYLTLVGPSVICIPGTFTCCSQDSSPHGQQQEMDRPAEAPVHIQTSLWAAM